MSGDADEERVGNALRAVARLLDDFEQRLPNLPVAAAAPVSEIRDHLGVRYGFDGALPLGDVLRDVEAMLRRWNTHVTHPRYFGLFNPTVTAASVAGETLAAAHNVQVAVWSHGPAAAEMERWALRALAGRIGYEPDTTSAHFTSGGQDSNTTAVVAALTHAFPAVRDGGVRALPGQPTLYVSEEGHHSFVKAAHIAGLGRDAVRWVPVGGDLRMDVPALARLLVADRARGLLPFLVVGTAGTTSAGVIDPLNEIAAVCDREGVWYHVDAAWGGGALLSDRWRPLLRGIERSHSVTWDAHKWLSVPIGTGMFFTTRRDALVQAFDVASAYMPQPREGAEDGHRVSLQWSRRSIGLKVFVSLAERGLPGYAALVDQQVATGELLRERLRAAGWEIVNSTPLPVVCFTHQRIRAGELTAEAVARRVVRGGRAWISPVSLRGAPRVLRACITSYRTSPDDLDALVAALAPVEA